LKTYFFAKKVFSTIEGEKDSNKTLFVFLMPCTERSFLRDLLGPWTTACWCYMQCGMRKYVGIIRWTNTWLRASLWNIYVVLLRSTSFSDQ